MRHASLLSKSTRPAPSSPASSRSMAGHEQKHCGETLTSNSRSCAVNGPRPSADCPLTRSKAFSTDSKQNLSSAIKITTGPTLPECSPCSMKAKESLLAECSPLACLSLHGDKSSGASSEKSLAKQPLPFWPVVPASSKKNRNSGGAA